MEQEMARNLGAAYPLPLAFTDSADLLITDEALWELKRQSTAGCVLCELEHLDDEEEDWD